MSVSDSDKAKRHDSDSFLRFQQHDERVLSKTDSRTLSDITLRSTEVVALLPPNHLSPEHGMYLLQHVQVNDASQKPNLVENTQYSSALVVVPDGLRYDEFILTSQFFWQAHKSAASEPRALHVVISSLSGGGHAKECFEKLLEPFLRELGFQEGDDYHVHETQSADSITDFTKATLLPQAELGFKQTVVLLTGDGGVVDVINVLATANRASSYIRPTLALVPMGTGNALANSSAILCDHTLGLSTLARGSPQPLPHFTVKFSPPPTLSMEPDVTQPENVAGAVVFSWGLHAALVADSDTPEYRKHGAQRFQMAAKENLFPSDGSAPHEYNAKLFILPAGATETMAWQEVPRSRHAYVLVTYVAELEAGFTISPASRPLDGKLRIVHFGPTSKGGNDVMRLMELAYNGGAHVEEDEVSYEEVDGVRLDFGAGEVEERWRRVCVDGKIFVVGVRGTIEVTKAGHSLLDLLCKS